MLREIVERLRDFEKQHGEAPSYIAVSPEQMVRLRDALFDQNFMPAPERIGDLTVYRVCGLEVRVME